MLKLPWFLCVLKVCFQFPFLLLCTWMGTGTTTLQWGEILCGFNTFFDFAHMPYNIILCIFWFKIFWKNLFSADLICGDRNIVKSRIISMVDDWCSVLLHSIHEWDFRRRSLADTIFNTVGLWQRFLSPIDYYLWWMNVNADSSSRPGV